VIEIKSDQEHERHMTSIEPIPSPGYSVNIKFNKENIN
jgi:hypothetical protein